MTKSVRQVHRRHTLSEYDYVDLTFLSGTIPQAVLNFMHHPFDLLKLEVVRLIPRLAKRCPGTYAMRYLGRSLNFLTKMARLTPQPKVIDIRPTAFVSIGLLYMAMRDEEMPQVTIMDIGFDSMISGDQEQYYHFVELKEKSDLQSRIDDIFHLISENLRRNSLYNAIPVGFRCELLGCIANMVEALGEQSMPYIPDLVEDLFEYELDISLIKCLRSITKSLPSVQLDIERRLLNEVSFCLTGRRSLEINLFSEQQGLNSRPNLKHLKSIKELLTAIEFESTPSPSSTINKTFMSSMSLSSMNPVFRPKKRLQSEQFHVNSEFSQEKPDAKSKKSVIIINTSEQSDAVHRLILSLRTFRTIGASYLHSRKLDGDNNILLPFLQQVISQYLSHPAIDVRYEAAVTCCKLLLSPVAKGKPVESANKTLLHFELTSDSASIMEEILQRLLKIGTSDPAPVVRLCVIRGLHERYYPYLCQLNLISSLFLMLEDEALAVRACALQLLGRLARLNPSLILPVLRKLLIGLIIELSCGAGSSVGRETATRLLVVFLQEEALHRLVMPVVSSIINSLPLSNVAPRLVSISLEALGELATVAHSTIKPWLQQLIPHILNNMLDQNSSKQCISLSTMGKIAFGTGYVITPYLEYPHLLTQASDILPTTKRAPWELRREVFRLFGILGAIDPDRLGSSSYKARGGRVGGGYFVDFEDEDEYLPSKQHAMTVPSSPKRGTNLSSSPSGMLTRYVSPPMPDFRVPTIDPNRRLADVAAYKNSDNDAPAHLYMYEQYAMTSQPLSIISSRRRLIPSDGDFYPTVAIAALMRILKDQSLSNLHAMVMKAVM